MINYIVGLFWEWQLRVLSFVLKFVGQQEMKQHKFVTDNHSKEGIEGEGIYWWNTPDTESMSKIELEIQFPSGKTWDGVALLWTVEISFSHLL